MHDQLDTALLSSSRRSDGGHHTAYDVLSAVLHADEPAALAVITGIEGSAYRRPGTMMALFASGRRVGTLSSGCIEGDLALQAQEVLAEGRPRAIRYGVGSPYMDIQLPCGGGLDITLIPRPTTSILVEIESFYARREPCSLLLEAGGDLTVVPLGPTGWTKCGYRVALIPDVRFVIFGIGPEAAFFAQVVNSLNYPHLLLSPEEETIRVASAAGCATASLCRGVLPPHLEIDARTAVVLFFHDHSLEPPILTRALASPAFYIGAQGSRKARDRRLETMRRGGALEDNLSRLRGPVGLVPSVREPRVLAVSIFAEILALAEGHSPLSS
ncbi:XdhC family protein [Aminobacter niigataensis]|uniref:XdhC family protein n=1 Tax=Aminobacter niigataensis TaxID=83265 RepID=UPI00384E2F4C